MNEQLPKSPERKAAEIRYRSKAFGPGPEVEPSKSRSTLRVFDGVYRGGAAKRPLPGVSGSLNNSQGQRRETTA